MVMLISSSVDRVWKRVCCLLLFSFLFAGTALTQAPQQTPPATKPPATKPTQPPAEAGGPQGDIGPIAIPKKKPEEEQKQEKPKPLKNPEGMPEFTLSVNVPLVTLEVSVVTKNGQFIPGLHKENFRILEDGVPQPISSFNQSEAPITAVLLIEFANTSYAFMEDALNAGYSFASSLKKDDWVAVVTYDMQTQILVDFTQDKRAVYGALSLLRVPGFSETNLFDALYETLDRIDGVQGRKYIILVSRGIDTFSRKNYDVILKKVKAARDTTIYAVGTGQAARIMAESRMGGPMRLDFLQADNQMSTFAKLTGGKAYFPRFEGEFPGIFQDIGSTIRNQYTITYHPTNPKQDGTYRKLKVEMTDGQGGPMKVADEKGKPVKYQVIARDGYNAKQVVE